MEFSHTLNFVKSNDPNPYPNFLSVKSKIINFCDIPHFLYS